MVRKKQIEKSPVTLREVSVIAVLNVDDVVEPVTGKKITHLDSVMLTLVTVKKDCMCWLLALAWQYIIVG